MRKITLREPVLIYMYGMPGSGKSFVARQLSEEYGIAHVNSNLIRHTLFEKPSYDKNENHIIAGIMDMMTEQFLKAGVSVIYDISASRTANRRSLREFAKYNKVKDMLIWVQIDTETAWSRNINRDKRKVDDKYSTALTEEQFNNQLKQMQQPFNEDALVLSGKHLFSSQKNAIQKRLINMKMFDLDQLNQKVARPELVNLVSKAQVRGSRPDISNRNIIIR